MNETTPATGIPPLGPADKLTVGDLRDVFAVTEAAWFVCQKRGGKLVVYPSREVGKKRTNVGRVNVAHVVTNGGRLLATVTGVSGKEALVAGRRKVAAEPLSRAA